MVDQNKIHKTMEAKENTILYREATKEIVAVVEKGLHYGIPNDVKAYVGSLDDFLKENPNYIYEDEEDII